MGSEYLNYAIEWFYSVGRLCFLWTVSVIHSVGRMRITMPSIVHLKLLGITKNA